MKETNPKKLNLVALLDEGDTPTNPRICFELGCGSFAQADNEFCAEHTREHKNIESKSGGHTKSATCDEEEYDRPAPYDGYCDKHGTARVMASLPQLENESKGNEHAPVATLKQEDVEEEDHPVRKRLPCIKCKTRPKRDQNSDYCQQCWGERLCKDCGTNKAGLPGNRNSPYCDGCVKKRNAKDAANGHVSLSKAALAEIRDKKKAEAIRKGEICYKCGRGSPDPGHDVCYGCEEHEKELRSDIGTLDAPADGAPGEAKGPLEFPEDCMYGEAKALAGQLHVPCGLGYPALLGCWSVKPNRDAFCGTRVNMTVALCAAVGGGKNVAMDRAQRLLDLIRDAEYKKTAPAGTRALMSLLGDKSSGNRSDKTRTPGPRKLLIITHEMTDVLKMTGIENSTLASRFCDFWDDNEFEYPTKEGVISVNCRLSWIGGIPCTAENPVRFTELFGSETSHGLYDRLILGYSDVKFNYRHWEPPFAPAAEDDYAAFGGDDYAALAPRDPRVGRISPEAQAVYEGWQPKGGGSRIKQNCMKVALITTMMNREEVVTEECMRCAIKFMGWQIEIRGVFGPGEAVNDSARCRTMVLQAMEQKRARERYINIKRLAHDRKWGDRFGDWLVKSVIQSLADMGEIVPEVETTHDRQGNVTAEKPSKNMFKLRDFS